MTEGYLKEARLKRSQRDDYPPEMLINSSIILPNSKTKNSCHRCHRLKKKCSKDFPSCSYCIRTSNDCFYLNKSHIKSKNSSEDFKSKSSIFPEIMKPEKESITILRNWIHKDIESYDDNNNGEAGNIANNPKTEQSTGCCKSNNGFIKGITNLITGNNGVDPRNENMHQNMHNANGVNEIPPHKILRTKTLSISSLLSDVTPGVTNERVSCKLISKALKLNRHFDEEFVNLKPIGEKKLALAFAANYFCNYSHIYPIFSEDQIVSKLKQMDFEKENVVNCHTYLILSIGCLIYDSIHMTKHYNKCFSESLIDSVIDITNFNPKSCNTESELNDIKTMILFTVHYMNRNDDLVVSNMITILSRIILKFEFFKLNSGDKFKMIKNCIFWTVINLDFEFNLITDNPVAVSLDLWKLLYYKNSKLQLLTATPSNNEDDVVYSNRIIEFNLLQKRIIDLKVVTKVAGDNQEMAELKEISKAVEVWRVNSTGCVSKLFEDHHEDAKFYSFMVNLHFFYLLIESDQLSSTKNSEFSLQFLSIYYQLTSQIDTNKQTGLAINNLIYIYKLMNVVKYNLINLKIQSLFSNFKMNIPVITNLFRILRVKYPIIDDQMMARFEKLSSISSYDEKLLNEVDEILELLE
ncbi:hypothetical protein CLIB1444_14S01508 [[Candida] jaroonii]|uniref:Uncharacterized protein n=1 Tax=[Candida] jaroonii TaxID=467808 RepID=A0ACA9YE26_9ASCO|nr:hypothetical protein CLIB1444_14S01508 [[Candida] jaroonii]